MEHNQLYFEINTYTENNSKYVNNINVERL